MKVFNGYIQSKSSTRQTPQHLHFRCGMTHLNYSLKKLGKTFKIPKSLLKTEMDHDEINEANCKEKRSKWLPYVKNDVLCTAYCYARFCRAMQEIPGFSMKDCLSLPGLGLKYFNSIRTEDDEPIYTYNDKYMRHFVRQAAYGGRVCAFNQNYKSKSCDNFLKILSDELNVKRNVYDIIEAYMKNKNKYFKIFEKQYENQFTDYRDENLEEKEQYIKLKLGDLPIHQLIKRLKIIELLWNYECVSLYLSAM